MKYFYLFITIIICCSGCSSKTYYNPYQINENSFEIKNINGKDVLFLKQNNYTESFQRKTEDRHIVKRNIYDLDANSIQYAINGPLHHNCYAVVYRPYYINTSNVFFVNSLYCEKVNSRYIKSLYKALKNNNSNAAKNITYNIFSEANTTISNYILYGKNSQGKNVGYLYIIGKENIGIVFYYPDNFSSIIKDIWKGPFDLGWNNTVENFISLMKEYNPHLSITKKHNNTNTYYLIKYK